MSSDKQKAIACCNNDSGHKELTVLVVRGNAFATCLVLGWSLYSFVQQTKGLIQCTQDATF